MKHLGDITKIHGCTAPVVDCIIGGSPCQDLSIAGARAGFNGERSVLFLDQIRVTKEMRHRDRASGRTGEFIRPRYMVWENVPGAFSSNGGRDFQSVLTETVRVVEPEAPPVPMPEKGWPTSGCLMGDGWSVAWRVLDAQFWGVPQRRRRIALVADFGGKSAPEILFVRKSLSGDSEPGRAEREGTSSGAEKNAGNPVWCLQGNGIDRADTAGCNGKGWKEDVCYTLNTIDRPAVCAGFSANLGAKAHGMGYMDEQAPTLSSQRHDASALCLNDQGGSVMGISENVSGTLRAQAHGHQPAVMAFDTTQITSKQNGSIPAFGKPCHTLNANAHVPCAVLDMSHACDVMQECGDTVPTMGARMGTGGNQVPLTYQKVTGPLMANSHPGSYSGQDAYNDMFVCHTLKAKANLDFREDSETYPVQNHQVRRLTPLECERLQGFPDGWTDIGEWTDSKGKLHKESSDSSRYKALGNSIALPPWKWVLKRLCAQYERDATMASLFDGIAGFPLIWEQLNGKDSCLWASEIEEFPIAVSKYHFGGESHE